MHCFSDKPWKIERTGWDVGTASSWVCLFWRIPGTLFLGGLRKRSGSHPVWGFPNLETTLMSGSVLPFLLGRASMGNASSFEVVT